MGTTPDEQAVCRELAVLADRTDLSEEVARLTAHLTELERVLGLEGPIGQRLEFLAVELLREANTMCSKTVDTALLQDLLEIKVEVGKIKEQVANVE